MLLFLVTDDKGASTQVSPNIKMCACKHGGQCVPPEPDDPLNTDIKFEYLGCACLGGYTGRFCDSDIDACDLNAQPCFERSKCIDLPPPANERGFQCGPCPSGYTGDGSLCAGKGTNRIVELQVVKSWSRPLVYKYDDVIFELPSLT